MFSTMVAAYTILQPQSQINIVPKPTNLTIEKGTFTLNSQTTVFGSDQIVRQVQNAIGSATGFPLRQSISFPDSNAIIFQSIRNQDQIPEEGYILAVNPSDITITASSESGFFYALQTLRQMLPAELNRKAPIGSLRNVKIPCVTITDEPRFKWRGLMLDVARHFMPKDDVLKFIDLAAYHKLNTVHMHLTEDQGWRIEIKKYPKLTEVGAWRKETVVGRNTSEYDGKPHGGFYTQNDLREIVAYAKKQHINIVPEIDMPGHMQAAIASYPWLSTGKQVEVFTRWGVNDLVLNTKPETVQFCKDVLAEVLEIFPSEFIHIGGDECPKTQWKNDPYEQNKIKELGLKDEHELQSWFIRQMDDFLVKKGRRLIGWDEILEGGLAQNATVMSWRGVAGGVTAAGMGHDVVMSPTSHMYLDYYQGQPEEEPLAIGGYLTLESVYSFNPVTSQIPADKAHHILGVQGNIWTEYIKDMKHVEYMAYPRACAVAEIGWTKQEDRNYREFLNRLDHHYPRLKALDVNFRAPKPEPVPAGSWSPNQMSTEYKILSWDITESIRESGNYQVKFQYSKGAHRLNIEWAEIVVNGNAMGRDEHFGRTGGESVANTYKFELNDLKPNSKVSLRASVSSGGGTDSSGNIYIRKIN